MYEVLAAVVSSAFALVFAGVGWLSKRLTREQRLITSLRTLAEVYAGLPDSSERDRFGRSVTAAAGEYNEWVDPDNRRRRGWITTVVVVIYVVVMAGSALFASAIKAAGGLWLSVLIGAAAGALIVIVSAVVADAFDRRLARKRQRDEEANEEQRRALRYDAIQKGEAPTV